MKKRIFSLTLRREDGVYFLSIEGSPEIEDFFRTQEIKDTDRIQYLPDSGRVQFYPASPRSQALASETSSRDSFPERLVGSNKEVNLWPLRLKGYSENAVTINLGSIFFYSEDELIHYAKRIKELVKGLYTTYIRPVRVSTTLAVEEV